MFGANDDWFCMKSAYGVWGSAGYSGIRQISEFDFSEIDEDYVYHIAYKGSDKTTLTFSLWGTDGKEVAMSPISYYTADKWQEIEYEIGEYSDLKFGNFTQSAEHTPAMYSPSFKIDGLDKTLNLDAIFIYKK